MKLERCEAGHFYDGEKYEECPFCRKLPGEGGTGAGVRPDSGFYMQWKDAEAAADGNRTMPRINEDELESHYFVTGWLVCVKGPERGRDYRLRHGFNHIGRSHKMDVCIFEDDGVSRGIHCSVVYENKKNQFLLVPGKGSLTWKGEKLVEEPVLLLNGESFRIGETTLMFIAFCRDGVRWEQL